MLNIVNLTNHKLANFIELVQNSADNNNNFFPFQNKILIYTIHSKYLQGNSTKQKIFTSIDNKNGLKFKKNNSK